MISENTIREEGFNNRNVQLHQVLRDIPMTVDQRNDVDDLIDGLEELFREANR
jgi:hypothetical protein